MPIDLNYPNEHKLIMFLKNAKDELVANKVYFANIFKRDENSDLRKVIILDDNFTQFEYYYPVDGVKFNEEIEVLNSIVIGEWLELNQI